MRSSERLLALISAMAVSVAGELPLFNYTYNMQQSTIAMPCNYTGKTTCMQSASYIKKDRYIHLTCLTVSHCCAGFMDMSGDIGRFGIIDFDWSNAKVRVRVVWMPCCLRSRK